MAINRDIVATRKLNKENKARLGRGGDTEIRKVDGRDSHVNALEAYLIDVNGKAGEEYAKRVGSGGTNPLTGMPEYQDPQRLSYEELQGLSDTDYSEYLAQWGISTEQAAAIEDPRGAGAKERGFAGEEQALALSRAGDVRGMAERQLGATRDIGVEQLGLERQFAEQGLGQAQQFAMAGAGAQYQTQTAGLASGLASGQRAAGRGLAQARAGAASAAGRSGFARGSAQAGFESQRRDVMAGSRDMSKQYQAGRAQATGGLGMAQRQAGARYELGMQQTAATEALGLKSAASAYDIGMAGAAADYQYSTDVADLSLRQDIFGIQQAEEEKLYAGLATHGGEATAFISGGVKTMPDGTRLVKGVKGSGWVLEGSPDDPSVAGAGINI